MEDLTGKQLGQYQLVAPLGEGGMAVVYKAYQPSMERYVALKILPHHYTTDPDFIRRFKQEARIIASLEHPNILPVYDYGEEDGYTFLVMRYIEGGKTLADLMQGQPLPLSQIHNILSKIAAALDYAHARGVVHRDLKPSNVLIDQQDNPLLSDFGLAKVFVSSPKLTASGAFLGTPTYASPEQCLGSRDLDGRSDVYSLGVILYEMTTGRPPFDAETPMAIVIKHIHDPLPLPRKLNPALSENVELVILKALAKQPNDRYQTAGEMVNALAGAIAETIKETLTSIPSKPDLSVTKVTRRRPRPTWGWALGLLVLLVMLIIIVGLGIKIFPALLRPANTSTSIAIYKTPILSPTPRQLGSAIQTDVVQTAGVIPTATQSPALPQPSKTPTRFSSPTETPVSSTSSPTLTPATEALVLNYGDVMTKTISSVGEVNTYAFEGKMGDVVLINTVGTNDSPWLNLNVEVLDPQGNALEGDMLDVFYLPVDGRYTIQIRDENSRIGAYFLKFEPGKLVAYGFSTSAEIHPKGDVDAYRFIGHTGDMVLMAITGQAGTNVVIQLLDPRGEEIGSASLWVNDIAVWKGLLLADGRYTAIVWITGQLNTSPTGAYTLLIKNISPDAGQKLKKGESVEGELAPAGDEDIYLFDWQVENPLTLTLTINHYKGDEFNECNFTLEVFDAQGNSLAINSGMQSIILKPPLSSRGEYTVHIYDQGIISTVCTCQYTFSIK